MTIYQSPDVVINGINHEQLEQLKKAVAELLIKAFEDVEEMNEEEIDAYAASNELSALYVDERAIVMLVSKTDGLPVELYKKATNGVYEQQRIYTNECKVAMERIEKELEKYDVSPFTVKLQMVVDTGVVNVIFIDYKNECFYTGEVLQDQLNDLERKVKKIVKEARSVLSTQE